MIAPLIPPDEAERLAALRALKVLDTAPEERYDRITRLMLRLYDVPIATVSLVDANREWYKSCQGITFTEGGREISFCGHVILGNDTMVIPDALLDPRFADNPQVIGPLKIRFYAGHPLLGPRGKKIGTLCIKDRKPRQMSAGDLRGLKDLAAIVERELNLIDVIELQKDFNAKLDRRVQEVTAELRANNLLLERRVSELAAMQNVSRAISSALDVNVVLEKIMDRSKEVMSAEASSLLVLDKEIGRLRFHVARGAAGEALKSVTVELGHGIAGWVAKTGQPLLIPDAYQDPRFDPSYDHKSGFRTRSILTVPIKIKDQVEGVVQVINKKDGSSFDQQDLDLFQSFADMASISLENARLFEQTVQMAENLREALEKERWLSIEKEKMGAYIPKHVVDEITRNREQKLALGGKTVRATILFSDIQGFTRLSETREPQRVVQFLNEYMTAMTQIIEEECGILDKFIGDGIMAIYLHQDDGENYPLRAVRSGIRMQQKLHELKGDWKVTRPEVAELQVRVGINTGEVVAGNIGSQTRMDYTVVGDNVNVASRIESNGRGGEVHISEATYQDVKDFLPATKLKPITVKNRNQPVQIYSVQIPPAET